MIFTVLMNLILCHLPENIFQTAFNGDQFFQIPVVLVAGIKNGFFNIIFLQRFQFKTSVVKNINTFHSVNKSQGVEYIIRITASDTQFQNLFLIGFAKLGRCSVSNDFSFIENQHPVAGSLNFVQYMGTEDNGFFLFPYF